MEVAAAPPLLGVLIATVVLIAGAYAGSVLDDVLGALVAADPVDWRRAANRPWRRAALLAVQRPTTTERPDAIAWVLAPALYAGLAAAALTVVPWTQRFAFADVRAGIVLFGAAEALAIIAIFLHGWAPNAALPLVAGYRFVAIALSYELLSMFVLIAAALPAESLRLTEIVAAQESLWNVLAQPLGLPLFLVVSLGVTFWGPLNLADSRDLGGGTAAEAAGAQLLAWRFARGGMLVTFAAMGATVFLGGPLGPVLPGPVWVLLKTLALLVVLLLAGHLWARVAAPRLVRWLWTILLPLAFLHLAIAAIGALP